MVSDPLASVDDSKKAPWACSIKRVPKGLFVANAGELTT